MFKTIKRKLFLNFLLFILINASGIYIINLINIHRQEYSLDAQSKLIESAYTNNYKNFKIMAHEFSLMFQNNEQLIELLFQVNGAENKQKNLLRNKAYNLLLKDFKRLQLLGISQIHFYSKDNRSFLRLNQPDKFGDKKLILRKDIIRTNKNQAIQEGYGISKYSNGIKFTYPLFDKYHQYISGVEITYSTNTMIKNMLTKFSYDIHILVANHLIANTINKCQIKTHCEKSWESSNYRIDNTTHKALKIMNLYHTLQSPKLELTIEKNLQMKKLFSLPVVHNYTNLVMTFLPLPNILGKPSDIYLVSYTESDYLSELVLENRYLLILYLSFTLLTFFFTSYVLISHDKFEKLALYDNVTGLPNRTLALIELENEINRSYRKQNKFALLFIDLDGFKGVNDTYGHQVGDELLQYSASVFTKNTRTSDTVSRIGGDEFVIILNDIGDIQSATNLANKIIQNISKPFSLHNNEIHIGASIGIAIYPDHATHEDALIKIADDMMYQSKQNGKNRVTVFENL